MEIIAMPVGTVPRMADGTLIESLETTTDLVDVTRGPTFYDAGDWQRIKVPGPVVFLLNGAPVSQERFDEALEAWKTKVVRIVPSTEEGLWKH